MAPPYLGVRCHCCHPPWHSGLWGLLAGEVEVGHWPARREPGEAVAVAVVVGVLSALRPLGLKGREERAST